MPRNVRRRTVARKRQTKWCAISALLVAPNQSSIAVADGIPLCSNQDAAADQADPLIGWCRGSISLSRIRFGLEAPVVAYAIVMMRLVPGTTTFVQTFNPFDTDDLERQDILTMGHIPVPPVLLQADNTEVANSQSSVVNINCKVGRRFKRNANMLTLWIASAGGEDNMVETTSTIRSLMKFG